MSLLHEMNDAVLMHVVLSYLDDSDAIARLVAVNKAIKPFLIYRRVNRALRQSLLNDIMSYGRYLPIIITTVKDVTSLSDLNQSIDHSNVIADLSLSSDQFDKKHVSANPLSIIRLKKLVFHKDFNDPIVKDDIPGTIEHLTFGHRFNQPILKNVLPWSLKYLCFGHEFNQHLVPGCIPGRAERLVFGSCFDQSLPFDTLPLSITHLCFLFPFVRPRSFTQSARLKVLVADVHPDLGRHVVFPPLLEQFHSRYYPVLSPSRIPATMTHLSVGNYEGVLLKPGRLPSTLKSLNLCTYDSAELKPGVIPSSLLTLTLKDFDQAFAPNTLPSGLQKLKLIAPGPLTLASLHTPSLTHLTVYTRNKYPTFPSHIPNTVSHLTVHLATTIAIRSNDVPQSVTHLTIAGFYDNIQVDPHALPSSITHLTIDKISSGLRRDILPPLVTHLDLGSCDNYAFDAAILPASVSRLTFSDSFSQPIILPETVTHLVYPTLNHVWRKCSLPGVTHLTVLYDDLFDYKMLASIPALTHLKFISDMQHPDPFLFSDLV